MNTKQDYDNCRKLVALIERDAELSADVQYPIDKDWGSHVAYKTGWQISSLEGALTRIATGISVTEEIERLQKRVDGQEASK